MPEFVDLRPQQEFWPGDCQTGSLTSPAVFLVGWHFPPVQDIWGFGSTVAQLSQAMAKRSIELHVGLCVGETFEWSKLRCRVQFDCIGDVNED